MFILIQKVSIVVRHFVIFILATFGKKRELHDLIPIRLINQLSTLFKSKLSLEKRFIAYCSEHRLDSHAPFYQDHFVLFSLEYLTPFKREENPERYFLDIGATDGIGISNTYLLEKKYFWNGLVVEPAQKWHTELALNRSAIIDQRCVWSTSHLMLPFLETENAGQSGLKCVDERDAFSKDRAAYRAYDVETISLIHLLECHQAPSIIDYLSLDTEGAEYTILKDFDFDKYKFKVITVEHNYNKKNCEDLYNLLVSKGYVRILRLVSWVDYWFIHSSFYSQLNLMGNPSERPKAPEVEFSTKEFLREE
jgi:FkbM family methyltransferase